MEEDKTQTDDSADYNGSVTASGRYGQRKGLVINMTDSSMHAAALNFVREVKASAEYRAYDAQLDRIKKQPELYERVNAFREKNFMIQNTEASDSLMDRIDELDREFEQLREEPAAADFFDAETSFCRMMQEVNMLIVKELDFE